MRLTKEQSILKFKTNKMAKKKSLFKSKKNIQKTLQNSLFDSAAAAVGSVGAAFGYNMVKDKLPAKVVSFGGAIVAIGGAGLSATANDSKLVAFGHGVTGAGVMQLVADKAPASFKAKLGMHGIGAYTQDVDVDVENEIPADLLNQIADSIEKADAEYENIEGVDEEGNFVENDAIEGVEDDEDENYDDIVDML